MSWLFTNGKTLRRLGTIGKLEQSTPVTNWGGIAGNEIDGVEINRDKNDEESNAEGFGV